MCHSSHMLLADIGPNWPRIRQLPLLAEWHGLGYGTASIVKSAASFGHNHRQRKMSPLTMLKAWLRPASEVAAHSMCLANPRASDLLGCSAGPGRREKNKLSKGCAKTLLEGRYMPSERGAPRSRRSRPWGSAARETCGAGAKTDPQDGRLGSQPGNAAACFTHVAICASSRSSS